MGSCRGTTRKTVEAGLQLIVGQTVTQAANDKEQLAPTVVIIEQQSGQWPEEVLTDSGVLLGEELGSVGKRRESGAPHRSIHRHRTAAARRVQATLPERTSSEQCHARGSHAAQAEDQGGQGGVRGAQGDRGASLRTDQAGARAPAVLLRGIVKVRGEWALVCLTHNILKLYRLCYE